MFVDDISNFTFVVNAEDVTSGVQGTYYSFSSDFETWTDWAAIEEPFTEGGYYRFAVTDNAGNSTITDKYYYVTLTPEVPRQPVITYTVGSVVYTDVSNKGWFDTELTVNALFENYVPGYDQTHYVAKKFDSVAYQQAMSEAVTQEDEANALLAAIHFGEADQDDYLMGYATTTQSASMPLAKSLAELIF